MGLYPHQEFVRRFMSPYTPYTSLIMYHSLGSGKSIACIAVAVDHYLHDKKKVHHCHQRRLWYQQLSKTDNDVPRYVQQDHRMERIHIHNETLYFSGQPDIPHVRLGKSHALFHNKIIVLDEVHNVRYLKTVVDRSVYGSIIKLLQLCKNVKIIMATATPMTDNADQIQSLLGICNHSRNDPYSMRGIISYNPTIRDRPMSSEIGTDLYVEGMHVYASDMIAHQRVAYSKEYKTQPPDDIYRALTHISLFCFKDGTYGT